MDNRSQSDLADRIPLLVQENQGLGTGFLIEIDGLIEEFHPPEGLILGARLTRRLRAEQDWFENLVGHAPTVGTFYEALLRDVIHEIKPAKFRVGTGFVFDLERRKASRQLDIIVYDCTDRAPLFQNREFVVVTSDILVSAAEIKKTLTLKDLRITIQSTVNFRFGRRTFAPRGVHFINLFAYSSRCKSRALAECMRDELTRYVDEFHMQTVSGAAAMLSSLSITLPRLYLFDRGEFLEAGIQRSASGGLGYSINVSCFRTNPEDKDGLNEFVSAMLPRDSGAGLEPDLRSSPLRCVEYTLDVPRPLLLLTKVTLRELAELVSNCRDTLRNLAINGQKPCAAFVPPDLDWNQVKDLDALQKVPGFSWFVVPAKDARKENPHL